MNTSSEVVITGMGIVSPIGIGLDAFWDSLLHRRGGTGVSDAYPREDVSRISGLSWPISAEVKDFDIARIQAWKSLRRSLKVMSRDAQLGFVASDYAREDSRLSEKLADPARQGIVYGAMMTLVNLTELERLSRTTTTDDGEFQMTLMGDGFNVMYPLWMLKYLPNMTASHTGITYDLQGPSNTLVCGETAGVGALLEATRIILRGQADLMYAGGTSSCAYPTAWKHFWIYGLSQNIEHPDEAMRPFDVNRDGLVFGEGAATCILESRESAEKRDVPIYGKILAWAETSEPLPRLAEGASSDAFTGKSIENALRLALERSGLAAEDLAFVMASGNGSVQGDKAEAQAIRGVLGDTPVTSIRGATGHVMSASGMMEVVAAILSLKNGLIPPAKNCDEIAPECPIRVVTGEAISTQGKKAAMIVNYNFYGQACAVIVASE